ncbi:MAG: RDD family protein [Pontiellaceae bacterium]|nr:RDD family protein [Pontiellaceae bacterium]
MQWFYVKNGERVGPVSDVDFRGAFQRGDISDDTLVWNKTLTDWMAYKDLPEPAVKDEPVEPEKREEQTCSLCHQRFSTEDLISFEGKRICAACKPFMVQNLRENATIHIETELLYSGFWIRFLAAIIDGIVLYIVNLPLSFISNYTSTQSQGLYNSAPIIMASFFVGLLSMVIRALYEIIMIKKCGATLGKMAVGIKVVRPDGSPLTWGTAIGRYFAKIVSSMTMGIGYIMVAFDNEKRALHDRMCNTRVVKK